MLTTLQKWGNSHAIRLPKTFVDELHIQENQKLEISVNDEIITIKKAQQRMTFEDRIKGYTGKYTLSEWDTGAPEGKEIF